MAVPASGVLKPEGELTLELMEESSSSSSSSDEEDVSRSDSVMPANMSELFSLLTSILALNLDTGFTEPDTVLVLFLILGDPSPWVFSKRDLSRDKEEIKLRDMMMVGVGGNPCHSILILIMSMCHSPCTCISVSLLLWRN